MSISCSKLKEDLPSLITEFHGTSQSQFTHVSPVETGTPNSILFVNQQKYLENALNSPASALVVSPKLAPMALEKSNGKAILVSPNPVLALSKTLELYFPETFETKADIHSTAIIHKTAQISKTARIGAYTVIAENCKIADHVVIESHVVIEKNVTIDTSTHILDHVFIGPRTEIGKKCEIKPHTVLGGEGYGFAQDEKGHHHRIAQIGKVVLEDSVSIGSFCAIDRAAFLETRIGEGTKLDNLIQVAHNVKIGKHCLFPGGTVIGGSTEIGSHCIIGGHSSIAGHLKICDKVHLGGRSAVTGHITEPGVYSGHPLQPLKDHLRTEATLKKLPSLLKNIKAIFKKLKIESEEDL